MKLLKVNYLYPDYLNAFYSKNKFLNIKTYKEQYELINYDAFSWSDSWTNYLKIFGYETEEIIINSVILQRQWAKENDLKNFSHLSLDKIALEQIKKFKPEIIWFDCLKEDLLKNILKEIKSVKCLIGWVGSAITRSDIWKNFNIIFSCANESVEYFKKNNLNSFHINHAFDPRILEKLTNSTQKIDLSFTGQVVMDDDRFHLKRAELLNELAKSVNIKVFSPIKNKYSFLFSFKIFIRRRVYNIYCLLKKIGLKDNFLKKIPKIKNVFIWKEKPDYPKKISANLKRSLKKPVFGIEMFQMTKNSKVTLNIHANSSPRFASNMRLFEASGVGSCLLTDWKENINDLYEDGKEIVTYKSLEDCLEKVKWLLGNEKERNKIASAGQKRTLKDHTFAQRASEIHEIIMKELKKKK